jgi:hypothetical protein
MTATPDYTVGNVEFATQTLLEATTTDQRFALIEGIAESLTRRLLQENPYIGIHELSNLVKQFIEAVRQRVDEGEQRLREEWY